MASAAMGASLGILNGICQVLLATWQVLGSCSMLQLEAILQAVLLKLADGKSGLFGRWGGGRGLRWYV